MKLSDYDLVPSVIINDIDPKKLGRVKCTVPGYLNGETMSRKRMPWCYPISMGGYQHFSRPIKGQKVWVLVNTTKEREYWYFPMFDLNEISKEYLDPVYQQDHPEIVFNRNSGGNTGTMTYDDVNGYKVMVNQKYITIKPNGDIICDSDGTVMKIINNKVYLGVDDQPYEQAVMGNALYDALSNLSNALSQLAITATGNMYTSTLATGFTQASKAIGQGALSKILCKNTNVN